MIILRFLSSLFFWLYLQVGFVVVALLSYPARILRDKGRSFCYLTVRLVLRFLFLFSFFRVTVKGGDNLPAGGRTVFIANKPDLISTFALIAFFPRHLSFIAEARLFRLPIIGRVFKAIGCIPSVAAGEHSFAFPVKVLNAFRRAGNILFYTANLRRQDSQFTSFPAAELQIAKTLESTIIPIMVKGTDKIMPPGSAIFAPGRIEIIVGNPIAATDVGPAAKKLEEFYGI